MSYAHNRRKKDLRIASKLYLQWPLEAGEQKRVDEVGHQVLMSEFARSRR